MNTKEGQRIVYHIVGDEGTLFPQDPQGIVLPNSTNSDPFLPIAKSSSPSVVALRVVDTRSVEKIEVRLWIDGKIAEGEEVAKNIFGDDPKVTLPNRVVLARNGEIYTAEPTDMILRTKP